MKSKSQGFLTRVLMLALVAFLALPVSVFAQGRGRDNNEWRRQQAERIRAEQIRREQERIRAEEWRRNQSRNDDRWRNDNDRNGRGGYGGVSFALRQTALNAGYNNGIEEGRKDRRKGERLEFRDEGDYQKATEDYSSRLGDRELYKRFFREGFANGYRAGYNGY